MLIGHVGVALALKKAEPRVNLGWLCLASLWLDVLIWTFALIGVERVIIPPNYDELHFLQFVFPYSHSLVAAVVWSGVAFLAGCMIWRGSNSLRVGLVLAAAMASHWVLDLLVHPPEMPVAGQSSPQLGFGLWNYLPAALLVEAAITAVGLWLYYRATRAVARPGQNGPLMLVLVIGLLTLIGQAVGPTPPNTTIVAVQGVGMIAMLTVLPAWFDTKRVAV